MLAMLQLAWLLIIVAVSGINAEVPQNDCDVDITKHPYVVSVRRHGKHICSGVILDEYHIVTSDRCVPPFKHVWNIMNTMFVVTATNTLKPGGQQISTKEMFSQNHYLNPSNNPVISGLGVIKVLTRLQFGEKVKPIEVSEVEELPVGTKLQMVGWMMVNREGKKTACLKEATLEIADRQKCQTYQKKTLTESEFCTQTVAEGDFCKGDSGSPLIYEGKLVGVATSGISCDNVPIPDVHPSIYKNIDYLYEIIKK
ncbi:hypothetical protein DMN91_007257 [Ooceraea biroi]|uniref:Chymotrypsin-2 n=1 Tax=Ooceraea biroi TaxID=2015173 RepID=A0A026WSR9_OOCBI|nr:chymotrypsin-2 [Ooceraea biroi]EZA58114.1 Chymotrypsin-2 [Ooceraea biroi]RLU20644.1 hypothetical protein DMN91_007257 [Ooceraea biroi]